MKKILKSFSVYVKLHLFLFSPALYKKDFSSKKNFSCKDFPHDAKQKIFYFLSFLMALIWFCFLVCDFVL